METILLAPGRLLGSLPDPTEEGKLIEEPELQVLRHENKRFDEAAKQVAENFPKISNDHSQVSLKNIQGIDLLQKIEKSDQDSFIGANALNMVHGSDDNETDLLSLRFVAKNQSDYLICAKSDGVRYLMFVCNNNRVYLNDRKAQFFEVRAFVPPFGQGDMKKPLEAFKVNHIFDGELIVNTADQIRIEKALEKKKPVPKIRMHYLIFDTLQYQGEYLITKKYTHRLGMAKKFVTSSGFYEDFFLESKSTFNNREEINKMQIIEFYLKDFFDCRQVDFLLNGIVNKKVLPHQNDGLIFTKNNYPYYPGKNRGILKWKPNELNTLDFFVTQNEYYTKTFPDLFQGGDFFVLELYTVYGDYFYFMDFLFLFDQEQYIKMMSQVRNIKVGNNTFLGTIVECKYDHNLKSKLYMDFFDYIYESSSEGVENLIHNSKLYRDWDEKLKSRLPALLKEHAEKRVKMQEFVEKVEKQLSDGVFKNTVSLKNKQDELEKTKKELEDTKEFSPPKYPAGPPDHVPVIYTIIESRFKEGGIGVNAVGGWVPLRFRDDKDFPNNFNTAKNMVDTIFKSNISEEELIKVLTIDPQEAEGGNKKLKSN